MLTIDELKEHLSYPDIELDEKPEYGLTWLNILPKEKDLNCIYLCMDLERTFIQQFGFGEWHSHPDEIDEGIEMARSLINQEKCIVEERNLQEKYLGSSMDLPRAVPKLISKNASGLRRVFFNQEPITEQIDFTKYYEGRYHWISLDHKHKLERMYRNNGMQIPEW